MLKLGALTITDRRADGTPLFRRLLPALGFVEAWRDAPPPKEASATTALVHEVVRHAFLLLFTDDPTGVRAHFAVDWFDGPWYPESQFTNTFADITREAPRRCGAAEFA